MVSRYKGSRYRTVYFHHQTAPAHWTDYDNPDDPINMTLAKYLNGEVHDDENVVHIESRREVISVIYTITLEQNHQ